MNTKAKITALLLMASAMVACTAKHSHAEAEVHEHEEGVIHLTDKQAEAAGLQTEEIIPADFCDCIRVSGQVTTAQGDEVAITAKSSGIVSFVRSHLTEGVDVRQGEVLARISAAGMEMGDAVAQNAVNAEAARKAYERAKTLAKDTIISQKELERARLDYEQARLSGGSNAKGGSVATSPITGFIKSVLVKPGEFVSAGTPIATVTKSCNLQLRAELPEKYFKQLNKIRTANFVMSYDDEVHSLDSLHGHLVSVGHIASEGSAYIPVTFEFVNDGCMVGGSFADIWLITDSRSGILSVPTSAVTEEQGVYYIYVQLPSDEKGVVEFEKRDVTTGMNNGQRTEILSGLKAGEKVVISGVSQVRLAGMAGTVPEAHSHNH